MRSHLTIVGAISLLGGCAANESGQTASEGDARQRDAQQSEARAVAFDPAHTAILRVDGMT